MSDVRISTNAAVIKNYCKDRLFNRDDPKDIRDTLRQIQRHAELIIEVDAALPDSKLEK